ncbi:MAG: hypothetical protein SWN10_05140 [Pseudomonadota bacterium]|nr:hypothetical protein [Alteromonadaceae bacterium]MDY6926463.1 hypothetical protein [Pseudomonadota bacterium]RPH16759.1 MAG: hypothetical protein CBB67_014570 [Alteromonadaceae bacterium TMED7]|tara:strand:+ start:15630 stop:15980 length:351 start_codon:yes stop_codon:yes gene_type:complete
MGKWVNFLVLVLLLSVSTQALSVVFDSHAAHQETASHLSDTRHNEAHSEQSQPPENTADSSGLDCQHCCHCHGAQHIFLLLLIKAPPVDGHYAVRYNLNQPPATGFWRNLLRPPIA